MMKVKVSDLNEEKSTIKKKKAGMKQGILGKEKKAALENMALRPTVTRYNNPVNK
jgi:hypothetical protein